MIQFSTMRCLSLFLATVNAGFANGDMNAEFEPKSKWYTRYSQYPEYCSTEEQMNKRSIPPLKLSSAQINANMRTELLHVTAIIRHGARTPWGQHTCWPSFNEHRWDCELKTMTSPPSQPEILQLEESGVEDVRIDGEGAMFLFEKNYNALMDPPQLRNVLNGTCQKGQLLLRGYVQELHNGRMLRNTYIQEINGTSTGTAELVPDVDASSGSLHAQMRRNGKVTAENMVLFDLNQQTELRPYEEPSLYYRADDDQRTIMSGQVLLRGLFGDLLKAHSEELGTQVDPTIVVHTADRPNDILSPNAMVCPRLQDLQDEAEQSEEFVNRFVKSAERKELEKMAINELHMDTSNMHFFREDVQDCMMTTMCNDFDLPQVLDDYGSIDGGSNNFDRLNKFSYQPYNYVLRYSDAAYSKLAFGPMWVNILSNILPFLPESAWSSIVPQLKDRLRTPAPKLALFSAHDTTILPILATLGQAVWDGEEWAPYASMIVIELHDIIRPSDNNDNEAGEDVLFPSGKAFRLVYNGLVLTGKVEGCTENEELCDILQLLKRVESFAVVERDCESTKTGLVLDLEEVESFLSVKGAIPLLVGIVVLSIGVGSLMTFYYLTRRMPCCYDGRGTFDQAASSPESEDARRKARMIERAEIL